MDDYISTLREVPTTMYRLLLLVLLLPAGYSFGQPNLPKNVVDSLVDVWSNEDNPDSSRLKALNKYAREGYVAYKPHSAFYFA